MTTAITTPNEKCRSMSGPGFVLRPIPGMSQAMVNCVSTSTTISQCSHFAVAS